LEAGGVLYEELFQISKLLLAEEDDERTPEVLLRRIVERCGAETGFSRSRRSQYQRIDVTPPLCDAESMAGPRLTRSRGLLKRFETS
jgi:hypothetical protein